MTRLTFAAILGVLLACVAALANEAPSPPGPDTTLIGDPVRAVGGIVKQDSKQAAETVREGTQTVRGIREVAADMEVGSGLATSARDGPQQLADGPRKGAHQVQPATRRDRSTPAPLPTDPGKLANP